MSHYLLGRSDAALPVLCIISLVVFMIMHVLPGDPAELMLAGAEGGAITPERLCELKERWVSNDPLVIQYAVPGKALIGDLGTSIRFRMPVTELIADRFGSTIHSASSGLDVRAFGRRSARHDCGPSPERAVRFAAMGCGLCRRLDAGLLARARVHPHLLVHPWLVSACRRGRLAVSLVLPAMTLGVSRRADQPAVRSSMVEVLSEDYIRAARAKGITSDSSCGGTA